MEIINTGKILVKNQDNLYLVLRSSEWPENPLRSLKPDLPGGLVETGEAFETAAARELQEEAGIDVAARELQLVYTGSQIIHGKSLNRFIFYIAVQAPEVTLSWEHDTFWWKTKDELTALEWRKPYPDIFKYLEDTGVLS